jgi:hypothetical protein
VYKIKILKSGKGAANGYKDDDDDDDDDLPIY